jgi:hypothetical protein
VKYRLLILFEKLPPSLDGGEYSRAEIARALAWANKRHPVVGAVIYESDWRNPGYSNADPVGVAARNGNGYSLRFIQ